MKLIYTLQNINISVFVAGPSTFAQNISGALGPIHYINRFYNDIAGGRDQACFWFSRMILCRKCFFGGKFVIKNLPVQCSWAYVYTTHETMEIKFQDFSFPHGDSPWRKLKPWRFKWSTVLTRVDNSPQVKTTRLQTVDWNGCAGSWLSSSAKIEKTGRAQF